MAGVRIPRGQGTVRMQSYSNQTPKDSPRRHSRLSARSWGGLRWFRRSRQITIYCPLFPLLAAIIGRRDVLKFSGIEGEGDGALSRNAYKVSPSAIRLPTAIIPRLSNSHPSWHQTDRLYVPSESSHRVDSAKPTFDAIRDIQLLHLVQKYAIQLTRRFRRLLKHVCKRQESDGRTDVPSPYENPAYSPWWYLPRA